MRESNFAFPAQNKACVCITSQLYDRRGEFLYACFRFVLTIHGLRTALDTSSPLPLFNSLTHLTYLTSTSPRIREIMTTDGGLERLVSLLHTFCLSPPPPPSPSSFIHSLAPPGSRQPKLLPVLNPPVWDKNAAYRFSLAFQCVVNIGVRGSEAIRRRVVEAGTLEVVGCVLEAWLAGRGFRVRGEGRSHRTRDESSTRSREGGRIPTSLQLALGLNDSTGALRLFNSVSLRFYSF